MELSTEVEHKKTKVINDWYKKIKIRILLQELKILINLLSYAIISGNKQKVKILKDCKKLHKNIIRREKKWIILFIKSQIQTIKGDKSKRMLKN